MKSGNASENVSRYLWVWQLPLWLVCVLVLLPLGFLVQTWLHVDAEIWRHLWETQLLELFRNTLVLVVGVGIGVTFLGVTLAWLTAVCDFPGRKIFDWTLILPLAIPAYVLAFVTLGTFDFGGGAQAMLRFIGVSAYIDVRGSAMVIIVMTLVLYPYVYLLARAAFLSQGTELLEVSRALGMTPLRGFFRVVLPAARPALIAGISLALMETLADFGAVSIFGFDTFTTAIYKSWISLFSLETAAQLASLLLLFVILAIFTERHFRPDSASQNLEARTVNRIKLNRTTAFFATSFCSLVLLVSLIIPVSQLVIWTLDNVAYAWDRSFWQLALRTFLLGLMAATIVICLALPSAFAIRGRRKSDAMAEVAGLGYAIPGSILAIGIMFVLATGDALWVWLGQSFGKNYQPFLLPSLVGLLLAYLIRFFRPGYSSVASGVQKVSRVYIESATLLGLNSTRIFFTVSLPLMMPGILTGALIVFVDVIKEMPASLLLRPFGWDTLAIKIYELTSEGEWQRAGLPALVLVIVSLVPVILLIRQSRLVSSVHREKRLRANKRAMRKLASS